MYGVYDHYRNEIKQPSTHKDSTLIESNLTKEHG